MFISVKKGVFDPDFEDQLNASLNLIDKKISNADIPSIDEKVSVKKLDITGEGITSYSLMIGNEISLFCKVPGGTTTFSIPKGVAPLHSIRFRALTEDNNMDDYYIAVLDTDGVVTISEHTCTLIVYCDYVIASNPLISSK